MTVCQVIKRRLAVTLVPTELLQLQKEIDKLNLLFTQIGSFEVVADRI